uniref:Uncharacterized protein n=1 Tax=Anguilla anguilla TaxID=7936 RepID=A0A0E9RV24_ANGAN
MVIFTPCIMNMQIITFKSVSQHFGAKACKQIPIIP